MSLEPTRVSRFVSLVKADGSVANVYHMQLIVTTGGFQTVAQHGRSGGGMNESAVSDEHVSFAVADKTYSDQLAKRLRDGWEDTTPRVPSRVQRYASGHTELTDDELQALLKSGHGPTRIVDPTSADRAERLNVKKEEKRSALERSINTFLAHPQVEVRVPNTPTFALSKSGGTIECDAADPEHKRLARLAALEIGGTFTARGYIDVDAFCVVSSTPERETLLSGTRKAVVRDRPARDARELLADLARGTLRELVLINADQSLKLTHEQFAPVAERVLAA